MKQIHNPAFSFLLLFEITNFMVEKLRKQIRVKRFSNITKIFFNLLFRCQIKDTSDDGKGREPRYKWNDGGREMQKLYEESLKYLEGYARALTESDGKCRNSDFTMTQTNTHLDEGPEYMCIMDRRDMKLLVKHIYMILYNPNEVNNKKIGSGLLNSKSV